MQSDLIIYQGFSLMKRFSMLIVLLITMTNLVGCSKGNEVSGRSMKSAFRSVNYIKKRLPTEQRIGFELSFWALKDDFRNNKKFLKEVGGKTPEELIEMGKVLYKRRKQEGFKDYEKYNSWDEMITHYAQERMDQNKVKKKRDPRDANNSVIYDL